MKIQIDQKDFDLLIEYDQIKKRIRLLGIQLDVDYEGRVPVFVGVLNGCFMFMGDLMKEVGISSEVTFVKVSSYQGEKSTGEIKREIDLYMDLHGRDVIIVEDIVETGTTLRYLINMINEQKPASVNVCTLLLKPSEATRDLEEITYVGFEIPNEFVVGYGLDYNGLGRNLQDIYRAEHVPNET